MTLIDLSVAMEKGQFRYLFYRLNVVLMHLPPLEERHDDIPACDGGGHANAWACSTEIQ